MYLFTILLPHPHPATPGPKKIPVAIKADKWLIWVKVPWQSRVFKSKSCLKIFAISSNWQPLFLLIAYSYEGLKRPHSHLDPPMRGQSWEQGTESLVGLILQNDDSGSVFLVPICTRITWEEEVVVQNAVFWSSPQTNSIRISSFSHGIWYFNKEVIHG